MEITNLQQLRDLSTLSRAIFKADVPEEFIRDLPAQTLYQVILHNGLESSVDLIEAASIDQTRILLDFDLWNPDGLVEDKLWNWLELSPEEDELVVLQKVISSLDLKIVAILINRFLEVRQNEEPTDAAPGPLFYTPDRGLTWIRVLCEDQRHHFLMSKLLAFLFESNSDVFYQLLGSKTLTTAALLEEEALNDRNKRLSSEGVPDSELAAEVTAFLSVTDAIKVLDHRESQNFRREVIIVETLARLSDSIEPLSSALKDFKNVEEILSELTLIINSCLVRFRIDLSINEDCIFLASQAQGALNLGLDLLVRRTNLAATEIINRVGLQIPFRVGLTQIIDCVKLAKRYESRLVDQGNEIEQTTKALLDLLVKKFPCIPAPLSHHKDDYALSSDESLSARPVPFRYFSEIESLKANLK